MSLSCSNLWFLNVFSICGRYRLSRRKQVIEEHFDTADRQDDWPPRYNIAPPQPVPVIRQKPKEPIREVTLMKWGLVPYWSRDPSVVESTINAKSETAATKPGRVARLFPI